MNRTNAESAVLNEFGCYFLADELLDWTSKKFEEDIPALAADSAGRLWFDAEGFVPQVVGVLRALEQDPNHPLIAKIGDTTLIDWRDAWSTFQLLVAAIAGELERRSNGDDP